MKKVLIKLVDIIMYPIKLIFYYAWELLIILIVLVFLDWFFQGLISSVIFNK